MRRNVEIIDEIAEELLSYLERCVSLEISLSDAIEDLYGEGCRTENLVEYFIKGVLLDQGDLIKLDYLVGRRARRNGIYLDSSKYDGCIVGLPFNIPFVVRKAAVNKRRKKR